MLVVVSARQIGRFASSLLLAAVWAWTLVCSPVTMPRADAGGDGSVAPSHRVDGHPATKRSELRAQIVDRSVDQPATLDVADPVRAPLVVDVLLAAERRSSAAHPHRFAHSARGPPVQA